MSARELINPSGLFAACTRTLSSKYGGTGKKTCIEEIFVAPVIHARHIKNQNPSIICFYSIHSFPVKEYASYRLVII